jgi:hypothetical protein
LQSVKPLPVQTAHSKVYGQGVAQQNAQRAVPLAPPPAPGLASALPGGGRQGQAPTFGDLNAPTERPDEPMTAGAPFGPGPGMEALPQPPDPAVAALGALAGVSEDRLTPQLRFLRTQLQAQTTNLATP